MQCVGLGWVPQADWLCPTCIAGGLFLIDEVLDRRTKNGAVEYLVRWVSGGDDSNDDELVSWQRFADLPSGPHARAKEKITEYNAARRTARTD
jgi:hypothetical protein